MMTNSRLNTRQIEIYKCFLYSDRVKKALATTLHAFHCLIVLQKMWGQLGRVPRSANHVMLLNANERRSISEEVRREATRPLFPTAFASSSCSTRRTAVWTRAAT